MKKKSKYIKNLLALYLIINVFLAIYLGILLIPGGTKPLKIVLQEGPHSDLRLTIFYTLISWFLLGSILVLLVKKIINKKTALFFICFYLFAFLYANVLRERINYGDIGDYVRAAVNLYNREPLPLRYLYPPLWASLLQPFVPLGEKFIIAVCMAANYFSLLLFFMLLTKVLNRYGFSHNFAAILTFVALSINVSVLRTLGYVQINFHVVNLILMSLLFYPKYSLFSALSLSIATHLKASPVLLVLPFLLKKDWKWLKNFLLTSLAIVGITSLINSFNYYADFIKNIMNIHNANVLAFREFSIDSLVRATFRLFSLPPETTIYFIAGAKLVLLCTGLKVLALSIKNKSFFKGSLDNELIFNSYIVLIVLMMTLSPLIWEHHLIFLLMPMLILAKRISTLSQSIIYIALYILLFLIPTFDFYPLSYYRLLAVVVVFILFYRFSKKSESDPEWFKKANKFFEEWPEYLLPKTK